MGVWRDPRCGRSHQPEETGAVRTQKLEATNEELGSRRCQKNCSAPLTTDRNFIAVPVIDLKTDIAVARCHVRG